MLYIHVLLDWNKVSLFEQSFFPSVMPCLSKSWFYQEKFLLLFMFSLLAADTLGKGEKLI